QLTGDLQIQRNNNNTWTLRASSLQVLNQDMTASVTGAINLAQDGTPTADLGGSFALARASRITHYLPMKFFDPDLTAWLKSAFLAGEVTSGQMALRGVLADFPFDNGKGSFLISGNVKGVDMRFAPDWPLLKQVDGKLSFSGRKVAVEITRASIMG